MIRFLCSGCKKKLSVQDEMAGRTAVCPNCKTEVRIPESEGEKEKESHLETDSPPPQPLKSGRTRRREPEEEAAPDVGSGPEEGGEELEKVDELEELEEVEDDASPDADLNRPAKVRRRKKKKVRRDGDLARVDRGLGFYYASILTLLAGFVTVICAFPAGLVGGEVLSYLVTVFAGVLIDWIAPILGLIGSILCLWAPEALGARGVCIASLIMNACAMAIGLGRALLSFIPAAAVISGYGVLATFLMTFLAWCLFMVFLRQLSRYLGEDSLAEESSALLLRGIAILVLAPLAFLGGLALIAALKCVGAALFLVGVLFSLFALVMFLRRQMDLIASIRQAIDY